MKKIIVSMLLVIGLCVVTNSVYATGESLAISANGTSGIVTQQSSAALSVTIDISSGDYTGVPADWWIMAEASGNWYYYDLNIGFTPGFAVSYQGDLLSLSSYEVLHMSGLTAGTYVFFFGVDTVVNGQVNMDSLMYDSVTVVVEGSAPVPPPDPDSLIQPTDLVYLGAFCLPEDPALPDEGWEWGGLTLAYYPLGNPSGPSDGYPGSLYGTGNAQRMWVGEIDIPVPVISATTNISDLNMATLLRGFTDIRSGIASLEQL